MIDNPSNPPNMSYPEKFRIWKDPSFWKGFLLDSGKGESPEIGFGKTLPFGRVFYWIREVS